MRSPGIPVQVCMKRIIHLLNNTHIGVLVFEWLRPNLASRCSPPHYPQPPSPPPPQWPSLPALPRHRGSLHVSRSGVSPLEAAQRDELPRGRTLTSPSGPLHACHLPGASQSAAPVTGWKGGGQEGLEGLEGGGRGRVGCDNGGQQMPAEATGDVPESIPSPLQLLSCNWWCGGIHPHSYISPLSVMWPFWVREGRSGRGGRLALTFTSDLCRPSLRYVWLCFRVSD